MVSQAESQLSAEAHARIAQAIASAETRTSGEIFCVLARRVSSYRDVSLAWATAVALLLPLLLIPLALDPSWLTRLTGGWEAAHLAAREVASGHAVAAYAILQALIFLIVFLLTSIPTVCRAMTPRSVRRVRVRRAALEQFLAHGLHVTEARTGVLIFASLHDRQAEIIADEGIHSRVSEEIWADAVGALATSIRGGDIERGFVVAIERSGEVLAEHFPPQSRDVDEIANKLVVI